MSTTVQHVSLLTPRVAPLESRGARLAARGFTELYRAIARTLAGWKAERHAAVLASTRDQEAREVRELAWQMQRSDPGFAADLYAAAARHEGRAV